jgi:hypothetical protein
VVRKSIHDGNGDEGNRPRGMMRFNHQRITIIFHGAGILFKLIKDNFGWIEHFLRD